MTTLASKLYLFLPVIQNASEFKSCNKRMGITQYGVK